MLLHCLPDENDDNDIAGRWFEGRGGKGGREVEGVEEGGRIRARIDEGLDGLGECLQGI